MQIRAPNSPCRPPEAGTLTPSVHFLWHAFGIVLVCIGICNFGHLRGLLPLDASLFGLFFPYHFPAVAYAKDLSLVTLIGKISTDHLGKTYYRDYGMFFANVPGSTAPLKHERSLIDSAPTPTVTQDTMFLFIRSTIV
jgi:hypothetical protein